MTDVYLLDKSALAWVPRQPAVLAALERLDELGVLATSAVIDLEIGYNARNLAEFDSVAADRAALYQELPLTWRCHPSRPVGVIEAKCLDVREAWSRRAR